jgi:RNA polymerase sigma factor (sigma-70 family)
MKIAAAQAKLLAELAPLVLGIIVRRFGNFAAAEDAVQEALIAAAQEWPESGLPDNPRGWLIRVAARRMIDAIRSDSARRRRELEWIENAHADSSSEDTLYLLFLCCHPSLTDASAIALTLRAVGGLSTAEIARAFLVPETTMAQRISRAKQTIQNSGIPLDLSGDAGREKRIQAVLQVLYLIFNEGYAGSGEQLQRADLALEAIRLTRLLLLSLPGNPEVLGLLALMLLTDARRAARTGVTGNLIPLDEQNRSLWNRERIAEGTALLTRALPQGLVGPYQLQAAIAALHDEAETTQTTDWPQILALYDLLSHMTENPVVSLNRAVALAMVHGPQSGLAALKLLESDARVSQHYRLYAVRAHLYAMLGERARAFTEYQAAAAKATSIPERDYLILKAARLHE